MRVRIALAILGTAVVALLLAGAATVLVVRAEARADTEDRLREQLTALADALPPPGAARAGRPGAQITRRTLVRLARGLDLDGLTSVAVADGRVSGELPDGVPVDELDPVRLSAGDVLGGGSGDRAWAAAPLIGGQRTNVLVATSTTPAEPPVLQWFAFAALVTLIGGAAVAVVLARTLTDPLRRVEVAAERLAAGDLSIRLPDPPPRAGAEVADLTRSINALAGALERSRGLERQFLMSVSHDLRTPLTSIRGWAEAVADGTAPDAPAAADIIRSEARRLERLVQDLLDLARIDARRFSLDPLDVPVAAVVTEVVDGLEHRASAAGIALRVDDLSAGARAVVDPDRLGQIVANLVENGLRYARAALTVTIGGGGVEDGGDEGLTVSVCDDGPGIAPADLPHVFERLYVARPPPERRTTGSGLGLAIVNELTSAMGGTVTATSPTGPGGGTCVTVRLPRIESVGAARMSQLAALGVSPQGRPAPRPARPRR